MVFSCSYILGYENIRGSKTLCWWFALDTNLVNKHCLLDCYFSTNRNLTYTFSATMTLLIINLLFLFFFIILNKINIFKNYFIFFWFLFYIRIDCYIVLVAFSSFFATWYALISTNTFTQSFTHLIQSPTWYSNLLCYDCVFPLMTRGYKWSKIISFLTISLRFLIIYCFNFPYLWPLTHVNVGFYLILHQDRPTGEAFCSLDYYTRCFRSSPSVSCECSPTTITL